MFKTITSCLQTRTYPSDTDINKISSYLFCKWLSGSKYTILAANAINQYDKIPMTAQYKMINTAFGGKITYIPFPKKAAVSTRKKAEYIQKYFNISMQKSVEYLDFIDKKELKFICDLYNK